MQQKSVSSAYAAAELRAREFRANHELARAVESARLAAKIARADGDFASWWAMTYFVAECLLSDADFEACAETALTLVAELHDILPQSRARVHVLMAKARQGS